MIQLIVNQPNNIPFAPFINIWNQLIFIQLYIPSIHYPMQSYVRPYICSDIANPVYHRDIMMMIIIMTMRAGDPCVIAYDGSGHKWPPRVACYKPFISRCIISFVINSLESTYYTIIIIAKGTIFISIGNPMSVLCQLMALNWRTPPAPLRPAVTVFACGAHWEHSHLIPLPSYTHIIGQCSNCCDMWQSHIHVHHVSMP